MVVASALLLALTGASALSIGAPCAPFSSSVAIRTPTILQREHAEGEAEAEAEAAVAADTAGALARSAESLQAATASAEALVAALQTELDAGGALAAAVEKKGKGKAGKPKLVRALKKPKGTLALVGEGKLIDGSATLGGYDLNDPKYLSEQFRTAGNAVVAVTTEGPRALSPTALADTVAEQAVAKGEFPGPLPVLVRADIIDEVQLADAKAKGADGVMLNLVLNGAEKTAELMAAASDYGLEAVVRVGTDEEIQEAAKLGASILAIGDCSLPRAEELIGAVPEGVVTIADVLIADVRGAWKVRDMGFNALIISDGLTSVCIRDRVPPEAVIKAMLSKGSVEFGLGMQKGRLEGAKESLGSLAM